MQPIHWTQLIVTDADGETVGTLGVVVAELPSLLDTATISRSSGELTQWPQMYLSTDGEDPDWDTPRGPVDWSGLAEALSAAQR